MNHSRLSAVLPLRGRWLTYSLVLLGVAILTWMVILDPVIPRPVPNSCSGRTVNVSVWDVLHGK